MKSGELIARTLGKDFHAPVVVVANPSSDLQHVCFALHEPAETDTLHASADDEAASLDWLFRMAHRNDTALCDQGQCA